MGPNTIMPVSCENTATETNISSTIRESIGCCNSLIKSTGLLKNQITTLKQSLLKPIEYVELAPGFSHSIQDTLKGKYTVLKPLEDEKSTAIVLSTSASQPTTKCGLSNKNSCLPSPKQILFSRDKIKIGWGNTKKWNVGSGMVNLGNTCYLNSTLQALFHVPSFANWLDSDIDHRKRCDINGSQCIICCMADVLKTTQSSSYPTKPHQIYSRLKDICRHLIQGHQEDAHEFLRYLMESMEKDYLLRYKNSREFEQYTKETTPINQILGGYLRTTVKCLNCKYESVTFQHFEDLLLDIRKVNSIEDALKYHFSLEQLEDMDYTCESCKKKVSATKKFSVERAPVALCIQLKRFSNLNGKISKHINISQEIDFSQYSSSPNYTKNSQLKYRLVSMITHLGSTPQCGHYTAIGCVQDGSYYQFDDGSVRSMPLNGLLTTNPYIIFYELIPTNSSSSSSFVFNDYQRNETSTKFIGPLLPTTLSPINGCSLKRTFLPTNGYANNENRKLICVTNNDITKKTNETISTSTTQSSSINKTSSNENLSKILDMESKFELNNNSKTLLSPRSTELRPKQLVENDNRQNGNGKMYDSDKLAPIKVLASMPHLIPINSSSISGKNEQNNSTNCNGSDLVKSLPLKESTQSSGTQLNQKSDEVKKPILNKQSSDIPERKTMVPMSPKILGRNLNNPFNSQHSSKSIKHKTNGNGYSHHGANSKDSYDQRNTKSSNGYSNKSLVPYPSDSDSSCDDQKPLPIVKTKAGPFQVTKNTNGSHNWNVNDVKPLWSNSNSSNIERGSRLITWNGNTSALKDGFSTDHMEYRKRKSEKNYDSDLDYGRIRKKRRIEIERDNPGYNAFQEHQNSHRDHHRRINNYGNGYRSRFNNVKRYHKKKY